MVRVPVFGGHSEAVNVEFDQDYDLAQVRQLLTDMPGVVVLDNPDRNEYPMPRFAKDKDEVFVGRLRRDFSQPNSLNKHLVDNDVASGGFIGQTERHGNTLLGEIAHTVAQSAPQGEGVHHPRLQFFPQCECNLLSGGQFHWSNWVMVVKWGRYNFKM